jgi:hypothetical protein
LIGFWQQILRATHWRGWVVFRRLNGIMAALFALAVAVQYNDPDPVRWMAMYGAACVLSVVVAVRGTAPFWAALAVGLVALAWAADWAVGVTGAGVFAHMFDAWEMKSLPIEEARETSGLLIVFVWMSIVAVRSSIPRPGMPPPR